MEYDRYQDDQFNRLLAWVWVNCESKPEFLPFDYMIGAGYKSREGLRDNPVGCQNGKLVNEEMLKIKFAGIVLFEDRGELKYENRLKSVSGRR